MSLDKNHFNGCNSQEELINLEPQLAFVVLFVLLAEGDKTEKLLLCGLPFFFF